MHPDERKEIQFLQSALFDVVDYDGRYAKLEGRLGLAFDNIRKAFQHIPPCVSAGRHAASREAAARVLSMQKHRFNDVIEDVVAQSFGCLKVPGEHELMGAAIVPMTHKLLGALAGVDMSVVADRALLSEIFSQSIGISQRRRMDAEYARLFDAVGDAYPLEDETMRGARVALVILGHDAMLGTVGYSLHDLIGSRSCRFGDLAFEKLPSRTGVPFVDRQAAQSGSTCGRYWSKDQVVRIRLDALEGTEGDRQRFFGAGWHTCLGRSAFLQIWSEIGRFWRLLPGTIEIVDIISARGGVFAYPEKFIVNVQSNG